MTSLTGSAWWMKGRIPHDRLVHSVRRADCGAFRRSALAIQAVMPMSDTEQSPENEPPARSHPGTYMDPRLVTGAKAEVLPTEVIERFRDALIGH